ncbi:hypothetical protein FNV43_RR10994 [Rhamnella rubrinervis]|uniref:Uncharacterized protein n=1 Tax=Rhamnella rubrinervis TaxID=2594499 RepID=A0A8K0H4S5_9ROSA|nr:hypothetical protein FNV43_RR10994 [Rhamnella rubrinervis]
MGALDEGHFIAELENGVKLDSIELSSEEEPATTAIEDAVKVLLHGLGENINREGLRKTPLRVAKAFREGTKERVYDRALQCSNQSLVGRLSRYPSSGAWAGKLFCLVMIIDFVFWHLLQLWQNIEEVREFTVSHHHTEDYSWKEVAHAVFERGLVDRGTKDGP